MDDQAGVNLAMFPPASKRHEQAALVRVIGSRLRQARDLNNLSLSTAAQRLGYANPSKLSKVENASDAPSVPLSLILNAARLYDVSIDYLFGVSDDWEAGSRMTQEREVSAWLFDTWTLARNRDVAVLKGLHDRVEIVRQVIDMLMQANDEMTAAFTRFAELNPEFEEMRGGSKLQSAAERAAMTAHHARAKVRRFKLECMAAADTSQLCLTL